MKRAPWAVVIALVPVVGVLGWWWWQQPVGYSAPTDLVIAPERPNPKEGREVVLVRMRLLANSLKLYREEFGKIPLDKCQTAEEAGLPRNPEVLGQAGHKWSIPHYHDLFTSPLDAVQRRYDFSWPYLFLEGQWPKWYAQRGKKLVLVVQDYDVRHPPETVYALRLDGSVDQIAPGWDERLK